MRRAVLVVLLLSVLVYITFAARPFSICGSATGDRDKGGVATQGNPISDEEEVATLASELAEHTGVSEFLDKLRRHGLEQEDEEDEDEEVESANTERFKRAFPAPAAPRAAAPVARPTFQSAAARFNSAFNKVSTNVRSNVNKHLGNFGKALRTGAQKIKQLFTGGVVGKSGSGKRGASEATKAGRVPTQAEIDDEIAYYGTAELPNNKCVTSCTWFVLPGEGLSIGENQDQICAKCAKQYIVYDGPCFSFPGAFQNGQIMGAQAEGVKQACKAAGTCTCTANEINENNVKNIKVKPKGIKALGAAIGKVFKAVGKAVKAVGKAIGSAVRKIGRFFRRF